MWISAGRPKTGEMQRITLACKAKYKLGIRNAYVEFEDKLSDEVCSHFNNKNVPNFENLGTLNSEKMSIRMLILMDILMMLALPMSSPNILVVYTTALLRIVKVFRIFYIIDRSGYLIVLCPITNV